jgi:hypothetical protein
MSMTEKQRDFDVFYRDYRHNVSISSASPEPLDAKRLAPLAEKLLESPDNFFGVVDKVNTILQLYLDDENGGAKPLVVVELLFADRQGYLQAKLSLQEAMALLDRLPDEFSNDLLPGGQFIG